MSITSKIMISSLSITFCQQHTASDVISMLLASGWEFPNHTIAYQYYKYPSHNPDNVFSAPASEWPSIQRVLDFQMTQGNAVDLELSHPQTKIRGIFIFVNSTQLDSIYLGAQPRLQSCLPFTDFSFLMNIILGPFIKAGWSIFEVVCTDRNN